MARERRIQLPTGATARTSSQRRFVLVSKFGTPLKRSDRKETLLAFNRRAFPDQRFLWDTVAGTIEEV